MTDFQNDNNLPEESGPFATPQVRPESVYIVEPIDIERESLSLGGKLAWLVIAAVVVTMISLTAFSRSAEENRTEATKSDLFPIQLQARSIVGQRRFLGVDGDAPPVPAVLNDGTYEQRLCYVILINETEGADEAIQKLEALDAAAAEAEFELSETHQRLRDSVGVLIESQRRGSFDPSVISEEDRDFIKEKLDWVGELALSPNGTSDRQTREDLLSEASWTLGFGIVFFLLACLSLLAGFVAAVVFIVLFATRRLKPGFVTHGKRVNIYIETFALWMVLFFGGPTATALGLRAAGVDLEGGIDMLITIGFFVGSLLVLIYPVIRGIKFSEVMSDIGWKAKFGGFVDLMVSPLNYLAGTPMMLVGVICVFILGFLASFFVEPKPFGTSVAAGHPIQEFIASGSWLNIAYVVAMACVAAPIVEETMFRGVLYRHLRELSGSWATWISVAFSSVFNGLIFAAIHPQGFIAVPLLTILAINFSLAREWRDSLIAPVVMHSINNSMVTLMMLLMM